MTSNADPYRYLHRLVPLALAGDPTGAAPSAAQPIEDPRLVSEANPYGTRRVRDLIQRLAGGRGEGERLAEKARLSQFASKRAPLPVEPRRIVACACGCGVTFHATERQKYLNETHRRRADWRVQQERLTGKPYLGASVIARVCACGCGTKFEVVAPRGGASRRAYLDKAHADRARDRARAERARARRAAARGVAFGGAA